jgi:hypothetical protein
MPPRPGTKAAKVRSYLANKAKSQPGADLTAEREALRVAKAEDYIQRLVDQAPPLSSEKRMRLASLLLTPNGGDHAA